ncbi:Holliday junction branch migration protein RuvA [Candidatus Dependentiae bacterium]|nr:Holliday junction branch migration protein RuvA [Candidatus Dependentiae bacterium]
MIYSLTGTIVDIKENKIILQHQGFCLELLCPHANNVTKGQLTTLYTYLHWNQEQGPSLFGFHQPLDKDIFLMIIDCPGIGPKLALAILEAIDVMDFLQIITQEDNKALSAIKGFGGKKAEQLILHLKGKISKIILNNPITENNKVLAAWTDLQQTLSSLNYNPSEIKQTTNSLKQEFANKEVPFDLLLRKALSLLAKK